MTTGKNYRLRVSLRVLKIIIKVAGNFKEHVKSSSMFNKGGEHYFLFILENFFEPVKEQSKQSENKNLKLASRTFLVNQIRTNQLNARALTSRVTQPSEPFVTNSTEILNRLLNSLVKSQNLHLIFLTNSYVQTQLFHLFSILRPTSLQKNRLSSA